MPSKNPFPGQLHDIQPGDYEPGMRWRVIGSEVGLGPHDGTRMMQIGFPVEEVYGVEPTREARLLLLKQDALNFVTTAGEVAGWVAGGGQPKGTTPLDRSGHAVPRQDGTVGYDPDTDDEAVFDLGGGEEE